MIPKIIFQSWKTLELDACLSENSQYIQNLNPEYEYKLYDNKMCRNFLLEHFGKNYVNAFDVLKAGALKCDLWRYAVLYIHGGIYIDMDRDWEISAHFVII